MGRRVDLIRKRLGQPMATKPSILTSKKTPRSWRRCSSTPVGRGKCRSLLKEAKLSSDTGVVEEYDRWQFAGITKILIASSAVGRGGFGWVVRRSLRVDRAAARTLSEPRLPDGFQQISNPRLGAPMVSTDIDVAFSQTQKPSECHPIYPLF